ncbi:MULTISPECIES: phosphotransferase enzyme family protein [unclassified Streptomyces]|uniref:phosphotransferase enzyme family protein n=1 Tax=unclassified Streptomyces TaxID=2593676 RepID=UPI000F4A0816|nr:MULTISPECIES: phosphotransferase [unclassified Streptomyces]MCX4771347.1 phosphotransferase [Streptomyces sp. NBC_01285]ROQ81308.1 Ser/Thr protein kinase RdoA (MazF antagonist) [Streptomyces sp. CEV 2-1]
MLRRYPHAGDPLTCKPLDQGLLNHGYRVSTTRGSYFLKHHLDDSTGDRATIVRQHRATQRLQSLGVPVAPPIEDTEGGTVAEIGGRCYALHPWVDGLHRAGAQLTVAQSVRLGALLGAVHTGLEQVMEAGAGTTGSLPGHASPDPADTFALIDELLAAARGRRPRDAFDELAEHRLLERRTLLDQHADRRPPAPGVPATGWVHGDFHPLNVLYRGADPVAILDWDRLGVQPRAEEAVRAAAIFFVQPAGELELVKVRAYARAYRRAAGAGAAELAAAVHRVWWERLNDFWILRWRYCLNDRRADPQFPAVSALAVWWTREYDAVREAFTD